MLIPPNIFMVPCYFYNATAVSLTFSKLRDDNVDFEYKVKYCCTEKTEYYSPIRSAYVEEIEPTSRGIKKITDNKFMLKIVHSEGETGFKVV